MMNVHRLRGLLVFVGLMLLLVGCAGGPQSPEEAFEKSQEAMEELDTVQTNQFDSIAENKSNYIFQIDQKSDAILFENKETKVEAVVEGDEVTVKDIDGNVEKQKDSEELKIIKERSSFQLSPLDVFKQLDEEVVDKFTMETENEEIILTYDGEEGESEDLATQLFIVLTMGIDEKTEENLKEAEELDLNEFKLEITMDNSDFLLKDMTMSMQAKQEGENIPIAFEYEYSKYNEEKDVTPPEETTDDKAEPKTESETDTDPDINKEDAAAYLDALIQATVYQDVEGYIKALPKSMKDSDNKNDGEFQRDTFKNLYIENTKQNMDGMGIKDKEFEDLGDAFLEALKKTKYDVVSTEVVEDRAVVTLSVEGINDSKVYQDTNEKVAEIADEEDLEMEELAKKNIEMLIDSYKDVEITEPIDIEVNVSKVSGDYQVLLQDEFLVDGFVQ